MGIGNWERAYEKYPEVFDSMYAVERARDYIAGPEGTVHRRQNARSTGAGTVEHLGDNRDIVHGE